MTVEKKVLDYWILVNALTQDSLKDKIQKAEKPNEGYSFYFKADDPILCIKEFVSSRKFNTILEQTEGKARIGALRLFVGLLHRQKCINCLSEKMWKSKEIEDPEEDPIALFTLKLQMNEKKEPVFRSKLTEDTNFIDAFAISPIVWALREVIEGTVRSGVGLSHKKYERDCAAIQKKLVSKLKKTEEHEYQIGKTDIDWLYDELKHIYIDGINIALKNKIDVSKGVFSDGRESVLLEFSVFQNENDLYKDDVSRPVGFQMDFFSEDLKWVYDNIDDVEDKNLSERKRRQMLLYIRSIRDRSLKRESDKGRRMNVLPLWREIKDDDEKIMEYYSFMRRWFSIDKDGLGKWPSPANYILATMQKLAINRSIGLGNNEFFSVNGPPGTGKTTLLKEIIADSIVKKALVLSLGNEWESVLEGYDTTRSFLLPTPDNPDCYFDKDGCIKHAFSAVNDFSILIASSNNGAVENISRDLPKASGDGINTEALDDELKSLFKIENGEDNTEPVKQFFGKQANSLFETECWGLVSVPLGNSKNIFRFKKTVLEPLFKNKTEENTKLPDDDVFQQRKNEFIQALYAVLDLRAEIRRQENREDNLFSEATDYCRRKRVPLSSFMKECKDAHKAFESFCSKANIEGVKRKKDAFVSAVIKNRISYFEKKVNRFSALFMHESYVKWQEEIRWLKDLLDSLCLARYYEIATDKNNSSMNFIFMMELVSDDEKLSLDRHLYAPYEKDRRYNKNRQLLFYRAMKLLEAFVSGSSVVKQNLEMLCSKIIFPTSSSQAGKMLTSLMLFVPVVSTTFASVNGLSKRLGFSPYTGIDCFGKLIIDEAGQAVPSNALGAILRAKNTVVVGDPLQIEPVVTDDLKIIKTQIGNDEDLKFYVKQEDNDLEWSVQSCADLLNDVGTYNSGYGWIGSPLIIHSRCIEPMFSISNGLSYDGKMRNRKTGDESPFPPSCWIDVSGDNPQMEKKHHNVEQQKSLDAILRELNRVSKGKELDLFIISPFKDVGDQIDSWLKKDWPDIYYDNKGKGNEKRIGTVHTFQGRQAENVIFMLGCNKNMKKSIEWVKRNIINVAFTRAKKRIYVIGDWEAWSTANSHIAGKRELFEKLPRVERL